LHNSPSTVSYFLQAHYHSKPNRFDQSAHQNYFSSANAVRQVAEDDARQDEGGCEDSQSEPAHTPSALREEQHDERRNRFFTPPTALN
jgi:hypothetical protein